VRSKASRTDPFRTPYPFPRFRKWGLAPTGTGLIRDYPPSGPVPVPIFLTQMKGIEWEKWRAQ